MIDTTFQNESEVMLPPIDGEESTACLRSALDRVRAASDALLPEGAVSRYGRLAELFALSTFELEIVLLCAAAELDPGFADLCAAAQDDSHLPFPTFQLALQCLQDSQWAALSAQATLRRSRLIEVTESAVLMTAQLSLAEPVLHFLMSAPAMDERLASLLVPLEAPRVLPSAYRRQAEQLAALLHREPQSELAQLTGTASQGRSAVAVAACAALGLRTFLVRAGRWASAQAAASGLDRSLDRILERDALLMGFALLLDVEDASPGDREAAARLADTCTARIVLCGDGGLNLARRTLQRFVIDRTSAPDQEALWRFALGEQAALCNGQLTQVATQFSLDCDTILRAGTSLRHRLEGTEEDRPAAGNLLLESCRNASRPALDSLAQFIPARAQWDDIVLPETSLDMLRAIAAHVRQQGKVLDRWGFADRTARGLGISSLFHGHSGTGKTLAAEVLANELKLDLYRIDLSQLVSKYIGDTEKNLCAIFDAAESTGSVLLFDEADALFGKRSEVRDSHDRYANIEVSYLLQRIEAFRGLAILTTNLRTALDTAFLRRISFFVNFSFPDQPLRRRIWERMFPPQMPSRDIDFEKLSRLNLPGGNIRNIALHAAYIAADRDEPVCMQHLLLAARRECAKMERPLTAAETGGWL